MKTPQISRRNIWIWLILFGLVIAIRLVANNKPWVETNYSVGVYPVIGTGFRWLTGWLPFSVGDIIYALALVWVLYELFLFIKNIYYRRYTRRDVGYGLRKYLAVMLGIYILFNLFWGLNYNREGIASQLDLNVEEVNTEQLTWLTDTLMEKVNGLRSEQISISVATNKWVFDKAVETYGHMQDKYPFLKYSVPSVKPSLFGVLGNYMGYMGYYNPFTGEAQVNTTVPRWTLPFIVCHEIAHQLGYAKENEANFVGYLAARQSGDTAFLYSIYFDLFLYANAELFVQDSAAARANLKKLSPAVKKDLQELREFQRKYANPVDKLVDVFYNNFLKLNEQPAGRKTYNKVVIWLMAYHKKYGMI